MSPFAVADRSIAIRMASEYRLDCKYLTNALISIGPEDEFHNKCKYIERCNKIV